MNGMIMLMLYVMSVLKFIFSNVLINLIVMFCMMNIFMIDVGCVFMVCRMVMLVCLFVIVIISVDIRLNVVMVMISVRMMNIIFFLVFMVVN